MKERSEITIYSPQGNEILTAAIESGSKLVQDLMQNDYIKVAFNLDRAVRLGVGTYAMIASEKTGVPDKKYVLTGLAFPTYDTATGGYKYDIQMDAWYYAWKRYIFSLVPNFGCVQTSFSYTNTLLEHVKLIFAQIAKINSDGDTTITVPDGVYIHYNGHTDRYDWSANGLVLGEEKTTVVVSEESNEYTYLVTEEMRCVSYSGVNIMDAIAAMCKDDTFNCEWWMDDYKYIHFGRCEYGDSIEMNHNEHFENLQRASSSDEYGTRLVAFGSSKNVPSRYRKKLIFEVTESQHVNESSAQNGGTNAFSGTIDSKSYDFGDIITTKTSCDNPTVSFRVQGTATVSMILTFELFENRKSVIKSIATGTSFNRVVSYTSTLKKNAQATYSLKVTRGGLSSASYSLTFVINAQGTIQAYNRIKDGTRNVRPDFFAEGMSYEYECEKSVADGTYSYNIVTTPEWPEGKYWFKFTGSCSGQIQLYDGNESVFFDVVDGTIVEYNHANNGSIYVRAEYQSVCEGFAIKAYGGNYSVATKIVLADGTEYPCTINRDKQYVGSTEGCDIIYNASEIIAIGAKFTLENVIPNNVPLSYFTDDYSVDTNVASYERRLMLPVDTCPKNYIDSDRITTPADIVTVVKTFDDIYPGQELQVAMVETYTEQVKKYDDNGSTYYQDAVRYRFFIKKDDLEFKKTYIATGETLQCRFQNGLLGGLTFDLSFEGDTQTKDEAGNSLQAYVIVNNGDNGIDMPNTTICPEVGDKLVLLNYNPMSLDDLGFIEQAEERLYKAAKAHLDKISLDAATYTMVVLSSEAEAICKAGSGFARIGQKVTIQHEAYFEEPRATRVIGTEQSLDIPYSSPVYKLGESLRYSRLGTIEKNLKNK